MEQTVQTSPTVVPGAMQELTRELYLLHYLTDHVELAFVAVLIGFVWWYFAGKLKSSKNPRTSQVLASVISIVFAPTVIFAAGTLVLKLALMFKIGGASLYITQATVFVAYLVSSWFVADLISTIIKARREEIS